MNKASKYVIFLRNEAIETSCYKNRCTVETMKCHKCFLIAKVYMFNKNEKAPSMAVDELGLKLILEKIWLFSCT